MLGAASASAVQLADGTVHFVGVPRLERVRTTNSDAGDFGATYYFTINIPADADEPLQRLVFDQREGLSRIKFRLQRTRIFGQKRRPVIPSNISADQQGAVSVLFDPPIPPGETVVVGLRPRRNTYTDGVYQFGVMAFPAGEKSRGQFLGFGRLHFYDRFRHRSIFSPW